MHCVATAAGEPDMYPHPHRVGKDKVQTAACLPALCLVSEEAVGMEESGRAPTMPARVVHAKMLGKLSYLA
jgi:hypothetical protein